MYISCTVYLLFLALLVWGGKFAGFRSEKLHEDASSLDATKSLRGVAALGVILHHISQEDAFQKAVAGSHAGVMQAFRDVGFLFVAVFFFWSGFGLIKSLDSKAGYLDGFIKRRLVKVLVIPFYVSVILYAPLHLVMGDRMPAAQWVCNFIGITMMNEYAWYPIVAGILYATFYLTFRNIRNRRACFAIVGAVILLLGMTFCVSGHFAWWAGRKNWWLSGAGWANATWWMGFKIFWFSGEWWVNSCPAFLVGMLVASREEAVRRWFGREYWAKLLLLLFFTAALTFISGLGQYRFGYWTEFSGKGPGITDKILTYLMQVPQSMAVTVLLYAVMLKYRASNPVTRFLGGLSLETYMMNLMALELFRFLLYDGYTPNGDAIPFYWRGNANLILFAAAVIAATIVLALLYRLLCRLAAKPLR